MLLLCGRIRDTDIHLFRGLIRPCYFGARLGISLCGTTKALLFFSCFTAFGSRAAFLLAGSLVGRDVFNAAGDSRNKILIAYPTLPSDQTPNGLEQFRALVRAHSLSTRHLPFQISAYSAARVLVEGLRRSGRELSREKLLTELEGFYEFETGLTPAVTFGPNRRVGALGAYVVAVDVERQRFIPVGAWITPE